MPIGSFAKWERRYSMSIVTARLAVLLLTVCGLLTGQAVRMPEEPGRIEGRVLDAKTDAPLRKATVRLMGSREQGRRQATTDAGGRFVFEGVVPGEYILAVSRTLYVDRIYGQKGGRYSDPERIPVAPGESVRDITIRLTPTGVITGRVVDADGDPAPGLSVSAMRYRHDDGQRRLESNHSARTNDRGEYRLWGLPPGRYYIAATSDRGPEMVRAGQIEEQEGSATPRIFYPSALELTETAPIRIRGGEERAGIDIQLQQVRAYRVSGRVAGVPLGKDRVSVSVSLTKTDSRRHASHGLSGNTHAFTFTGVQPGSYVLAASFQGRETQLFAQERLTVTSVDLKDVTLQLRPPISLTGRVEIEGDQNGVDLSRLRIAVEPLERHTFGGHQFAAVTEGAFQLEDLLPARYRIRCHGLPPAAFLKSASLGDEDVLEQGLNLETGGERDELDLVVSTKSATVTALVRDSSGNPALRATVFLIRNGNADRWRRRGYGRPQRDGSYLIQGVAPGRYTLFATKGLQPGAWRDPEFVERHQDQGTELELSEDQQKSVEVTLLEFDEHEL